MPAQAHTLAARHAEILAPRLAGESGGDLYGSWLYVREELLRLAGGEVSLRTAQEWQEAETQADDRMHAALRYWMVARVGDSHHALEPVLDQHVKALLVAREIGAGVEQVTEVGARDLGYRCVAVAMGAGVGVVDAAVEHMRSVLVAAADRAESAAGE